MTIDTTAVAWIASDPDRHKIRLPGTDRARPPAATLQMASRAARKVGVTRVADITMLDTIGIPTFQAVRPLSRTLAVSQGKGVTPELARLSAMMESVEIWHVEQPVAPAVTATPHDLRTRLGYVVADLAPSVPTVLHDGLPMDWVAARTLVGGASTLVPVDTVHLSLEQKAGWNPPVFFSSTNGLASGNTLLEGTLHALYEIIERDAMTAAVRGGTMGVPADPRTMRSAIVDDLCTMMDRAGVRLEVRFVPSPTGLPCFLSWVTCADYPAAMFGFGCHLDPVTALTRAVTEAAQARLTYIAGARDDLQETIDDGGPKRRQAPPAPAADIGELLPHTVRYDSLLDDLAHVVDRTTAAFGHSPLVVDLTHEEIGVPVVKVVAPGSRICAEVL